MESAWEVLTGKRRRRRIMAGVLIITCLKALVVMAIYLRSLNYENRGYLFFPAKVVTTSLPALRDSEPVGKKESGLEEKDLEKLKEELSTTIKEYSQIKKELESGR